MARPRFSGGNTDVIMAVPVPNIIDPPMPCNNRKLISISELGARAQSPEAMVTSILPKIKIFLRPVISAILPIGSKTATEASRNDMETQPMTTVFILNSAAIPGSAILTAAPIKGLMNEVSTTRKRSRLLLLLPVLPTTG